MKTRVRLHKICRVKRCKHCGIKFKRKPNLSNKQWEVTKFCSQSCGRRLKLENKRFGSLVAIRRICGPTGYMTHYECKCDCGSITIVGAGTLNVGKQKRCKNCSYKGPNNGRWKGGKYTTKGGYVLIWNPTHPRSNAAGQIWEHHLVMEKHLGRFLKPHEEVHHKNGIRNDNQDSNLELWAKSHPSGQRVIDLYDWAVTLIEEYKNDRHIL